MSTALNDVLIVTHKATGLYHILITTNDHEKAVMSAIAYWQDIGRRTHKTMNYATKEFSKHLAPFLFEQFSYEVIAVGMINPEAKIHAVQYVLKHGTDLLLTGQMGFTGASWTLNCLAKHRLENDLPPPYLNQLTVPAVKGQCAEIRCGGEHSLRTADGQHYADANGDRFIKLSAEEVAAQFSDDYVVTSGHRGIRVYRKIPFSED